MRWSKARRGAIIMVVVAGLGIAVAACGSSKSSTSSSTSNGASTASASSASTPAAQAPTGAAFRLGAICSCSGVEASTNALEGEGIMLWVKTVNASGGLNGHPVNLTFKDDAGIPATAVKDVQQMIQGDHVQALVDMSLGDQGFEKFVDASGVPVIGGESVLSPFLTDPDWFDSAGNILPDDLGQLTLAKQAGKKNFGDMFCAESSVCSQGAAILKVASKFVGIGFNSLSVSSTLPSYTAPCLTLKGDGADALYPAANETTSKSEVDACAQQAYKPLVVANATAGVSTWITDPAFNGALLVNTSQLPENTANPGVAALRAAIAKYDPSILKSPQFDSLVVGSWGAGVMFGQVVKAGKLTPQSTPAQVKAAVPKISGTTLDGTSPPLTITAGKPVFTPCWFGFEIKNSSVTPLNGGKPSCVPAALETKLATTLGL